METLTQLLFDWGYWGLFLAAFAAGSILPLGSEVLFVALLAHLRALRFGLGPLRLRLLLGRNCDSRYHYGSGSHPYDNTFHRQKSLHLTDVNANSLPQHIANPSVR